MRMDTVIMGGGLSALTCGITLAKHGKRVTIVASGQSTLLFNGGSMELLGSIDGQEVTAPLEAIATLPDSHPYRKIGTERIASLANEAKQLLDDAGINMEGRPDANHWRITPMGVAKPAWLTLSDHMRIDDLSHLSAKRVALMAIRGYLDCDPFFLSSSSFVMEPPAFRKKQKGCTNINADTPISFILSLFSESGDHQIGERLNGFALILTVGNDPDIGPASDPKRKNPQKALRVCSALFLLDPDGGTEFVRLLNEERCGTRMQTNLILNGYIFDNHDISIPLPDEIIFW